MPCHHRLGSMGDPQSIDAVLLALRTNTNDARLQQKSLTELASLAVNAENQVKIAAAGGIEAVVCALASHKAVAGVQESGRGLLDHLGINAEVACLEGVVELVQ